MNDRTARAIKALNLAANSRHPGDADGIRDDLLGATYQLDRDEVLEALEYFVGRACISMLAWRERNKKERR